MRAPNQLLRSGAGVEPTEPWGGSKGTTGEGYYAALGQPVPTVSKMLFAARNTTAPAAPATLGHGFLIDNLGLASS